MSLDIGRDARVTIGAAIAGPRAWLAMKGFEVKGWCPDAWRPMQAGDGLLVRVRPPLGRLTRAEVLGLCEATKTYGRGRIEITARANLQIRGVGEGTWRDLVAALLALGLVDPDPAREAKRNVLVVPDWCDGDDSHGIATALLAQLDALPSVPGKVGFAVDAGVAPMLSEASADFRVERDSDGGLLVRADGRETGMALEPRDAADALVALARWFVESGGIGSGRMAHHLAPLPAWAQGGSRPAPARAPLWPGAHALGAIYGTAFGTIEADTLAAALADADAVRFTPWRQLLLEGAAARARDGLIDDPASPVLRVEACPGAPDCPQASVATRPLATALATRMTGTLHVSGCAKGCACRRSTDIVLTGRDGRFDIAFAARAGAPPRHEGVTPATLLARLGAA